MFIRTISPALGATKKLNFTQIATSADEDLIIIIIIRSYYIQEQFKTEFSKTLRKLRLDIM